MSEKCPICQVPVIGNRNFRFPCFHCIHHQCIVDYHASSAGPYPCCPICRTELDTEGQARLDNIARGQPPSRLSVPSPPRSWMVPWHPQCPIHVVVLCCHHLVHVDGQFREVEHDRKCLWFTYQDSDGEWHCSFKCLRCPNELSLRDALQLWGKAVLSFNSDEPPHCPVHGIRSLIIDMKQLVMANTFMCTNQVNVHEQPEIINDCRLSIPPFPLPIIDILDSPLDESEVGAAGTGAEVFNWWLIFAGTE